MLRGAGGFLETDDWHACVATGVLIQTLFGHLLPLISAHEVEVSMLSCLLIQALKGGATLYRRHALMCRCACESRFCDCSIAIQASGPSESLQSIRAFLELLSVLYCCLTVLSGAGRISFRCCPSSLECPSPSCWRGHTMRWVMRG